MRDTGAGRDQEEGIKPCLVFEKPEADVDGDGTGYNDFTLSTIADAMSLLFTS